MRTVPGTCARTLVVLALAAAPVPSAAQDLPAPRVVGPRLPGRERDEALRKYGGNSDTEKAVEAGLDWLDRHALADGGWDADGFPDRCPKNGKACDGVGKGHHGEDAPCPFDDALSAMSALAFLGHGDLPDPKGSPRAQHLEKTLRRLAGGTRDVWADAMATQAFAEAEVLEGKGRWKEPALGGAERLLKERGKDGGWGYIAGMRKGSDTPYTGFVVPALLAARDAGATLPADLGAGVDRFLTSLEEKNGKLAYLVDGREYGYTPTAYNAHVAAALRELLATGTDGARHRAHLGFLREHKPFWSISFQERNVPGRGVMKIQIGYLSEIDWWYGGLAMFRRGGADWSAWWGAARTALLGHQRKDGCARGSWDPEGQYERAVGGRLMATALGVLILEAPYRERAP